MKKNLFLPLFFFSSFSTFVIAQSDPSHTTTPFDSRLLEIHGSDYLESLQTLNPFLLKRWNFYLDHSWYVTELPAEKDTGAFATIKIEDFDHLNIFALERKFDLKRDWDKQLVCKVENSNKALVLLSGKSFNEKLNEFLAAEKQ